MQRTLRRILRLCAVLCGVVLCASVAQACPMCNQSIADDNLLPHAFMYSILFMLGMPAVVLGGLGTMIYVKFRRFNALQPIRVAGENLVALPSALAESGLRELASGT
ncbi:MAG: hypothetical protein HY290_27490 [Planctomycetia bacterium]|nr:hypothetical protein [Planctomycetia bacterium]